ncbi:MAG: methionyl-tRNA formyltransferase [Candidatus Binatia bacterium]
MRIILVGQAAFAEKVLDRLRQRQHHILAVCCPPDSGERIDPVKARALAVGIPVRQHQSLKAPEVQREFADLGADLAVLAYVTQIVPRSIFETPRLGSICFHPSLLPRHRGGSAINWQVIQGETQTGVSVFWVDAGIDTGPILLQKTAVIRPNDTAGSLYYDTLFPLGVDAVIEAVELVAAGEAPRVAQNEDQATYDPLCRDEHAAVDWSRPATTLHDLIRGCDPQPGAHTTWNGIKLRLYDAAIVRRHNLHPGVIDEISAEGWLIGTGDGGIRVKRIRAGDKKVDAATFAVTHAVAAGTSLGT